MKSPSEMYLDNKIDEMVLKPSYDKACLYRDEIIASDYCKYKVDDTPIPINGNSGGMIIYHDELHIFEARGTGHYKRTSDGWEEVSTLPYSLDYSGIVVYNDEIHLLGGESNETKHYKWNGTSWTSVSTLPFQFRYGGCVVFNGYIYLIGGQVDAKKMYRFNGSTWQIITSNVPMSTVRPSTIATNYNIQFVEYYNAWEHYIYNGSTFTRQTVPPFSTNDGASYGSLFLYDGLLTSGDILYYIDSKILYRCDGGSWYSVDVPTSSISNANYYNPYNDSFKYGQGGVINYNGRLLFSINKDMFMLTGKRRPKLVQLDDGLHLLSISGLNMPHCNAHYKVGDNGELEKMSTEIVPVGYDCSVVAHDGNIHILGGAWGPRKHYSIQENNDCVSAPSLPYDFVGGSAVLYNGYIHILGSDISAGAASHYKLNGSAWQSASSMPISFDGSAVVYRNKIHIFGTDMGYGTDPTKMYYVWDGSNWTQRKNTTMTLFKMPVVVYHDTIHCLSLRESEYVKSLLHIEIDENDQVYVIGLLPMRFDDMTACVYNGHIYVTGNKCLYRVGG